MRGILWLSLPSQFPPVPALYNLASHYHVTLQFGVDRSPFAHLLGQMVYVHTVANCYNDRVQALLIILPPEVRQLCKNKFPHMTVSTAEGVRPVESNSMLAQPDSNRVPFVKTLNLQFDFHQF